MTDRDMLLDLARRCEEATGPDRELDCEIAVLTTPGLFRDGDSVGFTGRGDMHPPRAYTASIDAAMTLVPEGWKWSLHSADDRSKPCAYCDRPRMGRLPWPEWVTDILAATPALALTAAALRALSEARHGE